MTPVQITFRNYRGFTEAEPLRIELRPGFTALVGRNNSGKSAAKLFFFEFRRLFEILGTPVGTPNPNLATIVGQPIIQIDYNGITDTEEVFNNANGRPATIEIELIDKPAQPNPTVDFVCKVVGKCERKDLRSWQFEVFGVQKQITPGSIRNTDIGRQILQNASGVAYNCATFCEAMRAIAGARYYGPFRNAINEGAGNYYDLRVGTAFIDLWNEWKNSGIKSQSRAIDQVTEDIRRLFEFKRLEVSASLKLKTLLVSVDGQPHRLAELGSGLTQFIMVLGNAATNPPTFLFIDEPETHLHPALQIDFLSSLARYARDGVVFSTHSIGLARSVAPHIYSIQKKDGASSIREFAATSNYSEFVGELSFSTFKDMGSDRILLVEGVNDVLVLQQFLRFVGKDHTTVVLPLGGDQLATGREHELADLKRLSNNIVALVDSERNAVGDAPIKPRLDFEAVCKKLGFPVCITERRAIENYFTDKAIKTAIGDTHRALGPYERLRDATPSWSKTDNWRIAAEMSWDDLKKTDIGRFIDGI